MHTCEKKMALQRKP